MSDEHGKETVPTAGSNLCVSCNYYPGGNTPCKNGKIASPDKEDCELFTPRQSEEVRHEELKKSYHNTDLGNAQRLVTMYGKDQRYNHVWNKWLVWNGKFWGVDNTAEVHRRAKKMVSSMYAEAEGIGDEHIREALVRHVLRSESNQRIKGMVDLAKSESGIPILPEQLDSNTWLLNVENGTINLVTGELGEHRREDYITKIAHVAYDPKAECPTWLRFLDKILDGNNDLIRFLQKAVGYALTSDVREQCLFLLWGTGSNGKTTFLITISNLVGDYGLNTPVETLLIKRQSSGIPNDVARLRGARYVMAVESEEGKKLAEALIKQLTGGDKVTARFLHGEFFDFVPECKLFLGTNHKPMIKGTDEAIWRRIRLIPFTIKIPDNEKDRELPEKLKGELPGILNWAIQGCLEWQKEGLGIPDEVKQATEDYRADMDVLRDFLTTCCELDEDACLSSKMLYTGYQLWCKADNRDVESQVAFSGMMEERGHRKERRREGIVWIGIKLNQEVVDAVIEVYNGVGLDDVCRVVKAFTGFFTNSSYKEKNPEIYTQPYTKPEPYISENKLTNLQSIELAGKDWERSTQKNINSVTLTEFLFHYCQNVDRSKKPSEIEADARRIFGIVKNNSNGSSVQNRIIAVMLTAKYNICDSSTPICDACRKPLGDNEQGSIHEACRTRPTLLKFILLVNPFKGADSRRDGPIDAGVCQAVPYLDAIRLIKKGQAKRVEYE